MAPNVGVDDDERERGALGVSGPDAHGVLAFQPEVVLCGALPVLGRAHLLLAVDDGAREREEGNAVRAVQTLRIGEDAPRHFP